MIPGHEVEAERNVILEEIAMHDDDPDDVVHDAFVETLYGDSPLGRSITGTVDSINSLTRRQIAGYYDRRYTADNLVFAAAGAVDHNRVVRLVRKAFDQAQALGEPSRTPAGPRTIGAPVRTYAATTLVERSMEQATFVLGMPSFARNDPRRFALGVANAVLGGGTSSRLFQEVRETRGLAYTIYSFTSQHVDAGYFALAGGCMPDKLPQVLDICREELTKLVDHGLDAGELERGKGQMRGVVRDGSGGLQRPDDQDRQVRARARRPARHR